MDEEYGLLTRIQTGLQGAGETLAVAESCTGGLLARMLTEGAGSSGFFWGGVVSYSNESKHKILQVQADTLLRFGAVSAQTAEEMARGLAALSGADYVLAITGIAGPDSDFSEKPVGLVYIALFHHEALIIEEYRFAGNRSDIRQQSAKAALDILVKFF